MYIKKCRNDHQRTKKQSSEWPKELQTSSTIEKPKVGTFLTCARILPLFIMTCVYPLMEMMEPLQTTAKEAE